jgi:ABC-type transport system involved in cytochrome c biogenesis permease subunit
MEFAQRITIVCFAASYAAALGLEVWNHLRPRPVLRVLAVGFGAAGLLAQTLFLAVQQPPLIWPSGLMLFLAWILAVFYLYGTLHHRRLAWGVFVLPLVLGLVGLAWLLQPDFRGTNRPDLLPLDDARFWGFVHGGLLLLAAVGVCVGFLASLMYLFQAHRLRAKTPPRKGLRLLSLERLELMNRRAVDWSFPLLTAGVAIGAVRLAVQPPTAWADPRILSTAVLWLAFAVMLFLRYGFHLRGRRQALLTIAAFVLLVVCLALPHPTGQGGRP